MSHSGSHHYLSLDKGSFGLGSLGFVSVKPLFDHIGQLSVKSARSGHVQAETNGNNATSNLESPAEESTFVWRPDKATQTGSVSASGATMAVAQEIFYSDSETINCNVTLTPAAAGPSSDLPTAASSSLTVTFSGSIHETLLKKTVKKSTVTEYRESGQVGAAIDLEFIPDRMNSHTEHIRAFFTVKGVKYTPPASSSSSSEAAAAAAAPAITFATNGRSTWDVSVPQVEVGSTLSLQAELALFYPNASSRSSARRLPSPELDPKPKPAPASSAATEAAVDAWLASVNPPAAATGLLANYTALKMYYNAWSQFWYNTEHKEGYWSGDIITPSMSTYARGIWLWDTGFHVLALQHGGPDGIALAADQIKVLTDAGAEVGHIPRVVHQWSYETGTQPPGILTWATLLLHNRTRGAAPVDAAFLAGAYPVFARNNDWFYATRDPDGDGLCEWEGQDSGWDTSPRWDNGTVEAIDLNAWLCLDQQMLSQMASALGNASGAAYWAGRAEQTKALVRKSLWSEELGVYLDRLPKTKQLVETLTPATFWAMLAGIATQEQAVRMVNATLDNPSVLGTPFPMPCVSKSDPRFQPTNYWRGPVWVNVNYLTILGLRKYGMTAKAARLREQTIDLVTRNPVPREYYNPLDGSGLGALNFQWTGALFVALVNEP